jgi:N-acetylornithine carbamoyltransferase
MQTYLRGRDLISDLDFSKEEVETVLEVAFDLKRKRALNELTPYLRDKSWQCFSSSAARARAVPLKPYGTSWRSCSIY